MASGFPHGSRWGVKGTEDLGGGVKTLFQLENGFDVDTGRAFQGGLLFGRQAYMGLSSHCTCGIALFAALPEDRGQCQISGERIVLAGRDVHLYACRLQRNAGSQASHLPFGRADGGLPVVEADRC